MEQDTYPQDSIPALIQMARVPVTTLHLRIVRLAKGQE